MSRSRRSADESSINPPHRLEARAVEGQEGQEGQEAPTGDESGGFVSRSRRERGGGVLSAVQSEEPTKSEAGPDKADEGYDDPHPQSVADHEKDEGTSPTTANESATRGHVESEDDEDVERYFK